MKYFYIAVTVEQDKNESIFTERANETPERGLYAYCIRCTENDNIKAVLERIGGLIHANICPTKKQAQNTVIFWNFCYRENGTYLFDDAPRF